MPAERLQKIIAAAGIASRRHAEELITQGRVTVNGQVVTALGSKADLATDHIKVDGKLLHGAERHVYLLLNKPKGYVTTVSDPEGRPTVMDLVKNAGARLYPVGRLDYLSEGLLLMTNDGALANHLMSAASHVPKTYLVKVSGQPKAEDVEKLRRGLKLSPKLGHRDSHAVRTAPAHVQLTREGNNPWYEVTLIEGKNRQIRRMFEEIGHHVEKIKRIRYGALTLDVEPGAFRELTLREISTLRRPGEKQLPKEPQRLERKQRWLPPGSGQRKSTGPGQTGPRQRISPRPSTAPRQSIGPGESAGIRPKIETHQGTGPRQGPGPGPGPSPGRRPGTGLRPNAGPRQSTGSRPAFGMRQGPRQRPGPRPGGGPRPTSGPRQGIGAKQGAGLRQGVGPRPSTGPRQDRGAKQGAGRRQSGGPRPSSGPRQDTGPRQGAGSRPSAGPRQETGPKQGFVPRQSGGPRQYTGARQTTGPRQNTGRRPSTGPRHSSRPGHAGKHPRKSR